MSQSSDSAYVKVMASGDLAAGQLREVLIGRRRIVVGRLHDGTPVAFGPLCPHEAASLVEGHLRGGAIDCPLHHYLFDVRTGENLYPLPIYPAWKRAQVGLLRLPVFPVVERDGWIAVAPRPARPRARANRAPTSGDQSSSAASA